MNTKLQTHFLRRYLTKPYTALETKAAFVHLSCFVEEHAIRVNESFAFVTRTVNNYSFRSWEKVFYQHGQQNC
jgi:hypothetical protein